MKASPCDRNEARFRIDQARGHLRQAEEAAASRVGRAWPNVVVSDAVLAGVAAADAVCCARLGQRTAGENHQDAIALFRQALPQDKTPLATVLGRLLSVKTPAQYGGKPLSATKAATALNQATRLVEEAGVLLA
ncbi:MAG: hypothetical protein HYU28_10865 [Actinobacteria bacterium]|nr:hypothetical protein [Actinomycetota bacterium]